MVKDRVVQFVCFETKLANEKFIAQWEHYNRSINSDLEVVLQQSEQNGVYRYIAQHHCTAGELSFAFTKGKRSSRTPEIGIRTRQAGGYKILQEQRKNNTAAGEIKVFAFVTDAATDLSIFSRLSAHKHLNIYQAYYENCSYAYILEFFVKNKFADLLQEQLKSCNVVENRVYNEMSWQD